MLKYFIIFSIFGGVLGKVIQEQKNAFFALVGVAIIWGIMSKPIWGLVALGELFLGYFLVKMFFNRD